MSNEDVKIIFHEVYNSFWNKYKGEILPPEDRKWEQIERDAKALIVKHAGAPLVIHMVGELLNILDERGKARHGKN